MASSCPLPKGNRKYFKNNNTKQVHKASWFHIAIKLHNEESSQGQKICIFAYTYQISVVMSFLVMQSRLYHLQLCDLGFHHFLSSASVSVKWGQKYY